MDMIYQLTNCKLRKINYYKMIGLTIKSIIKKSINQFCLKLKHLKLRVFKHLLILDRNLKSNLRKKQDIEGYTSVFRNQVEYQN